MARYIKYRSVDISIAVALKEGLITPIIKNADKKGLIEISKETKDLIDKSKSGKLQHDEYTGGTISISNLGMFGITEFSAIINPPQSSILAVGAIKKIPGVINEEISSFSVLKSTLSMLSMSFANLALFILKSSKSVPVTCFAPSSAILMA